MIGGNATSKPQGRTLKLFLTDGSPTGVITAELGNWSGKIVVAPRTALPKLVKLDEAARTGVYLLVGDDPDKPTRTCVYVGESRNISKRLIDHDKDDTKEFFTHVCLIVSKDDTLTKAHGRYLEARIMKQIREAHRAVLTNSTEPDHSGWLPESDAADMEGFLSEIEIMLPVLDFDVLRRTAESGGAAPVFTFTESGTSAHAKEIGDEFVVLAGSRARVEGNASTPDHVKTRRQGFIDDNTFEKTEDGNHYRFTRDVGFSTPSAAASAVYGGSSNGLTSWKRESDGLSYKECRKQALAQ